MQNKINTILTTLIFSWLLLTNSLYAQNFRVALGARAAALGESALTLQPNPLSIYYNPASLGFLQQGGLLADYSNLFSANLYEGTVAAATPLDIPGKENKQFGLGLMVNFEGLSDSEIRFGRYIISLAAGVQLFSRTAIGANFKAVLVSANQKGIQQQGINGNGTGLDLAIHHQLSFGEKNFVKQIDLAIAAYDIYETKIEYDAKQYEESRALFERTFNAGAAIHFRDLLRGKTFVLQTPALFLNIDDRIHFGGEMTLFDFFTLRAGYARDLREPNESLLTFGLGLDLTGTPANVQFDYAYMHPNGILPARQQFTLSVPMFKSPPQVALTRPEIAPIFASFFPAYADTFTATRNSIQIENLTAFPLTGTIDFVEAPFGIGLQPNARKPVTLKAGERRTVSLPLHFTEKILAARGLSQPVQARLRFEYTIANAAKPRHVDKTITLLVHGKNYLVWDDVAREAAFITPNDPLVQAFKNSLPYRDFFDNWRFYEPIYRAAQFYEALVGNGVAYSRDTVLKFDSLFTTPGFDNVKYPAEILQNTRGARRGDCDDLVALYCSLLESANIATAIVGTSDHLLMLFDTGIDISKQSFLPLPEEMQLHFANSGDPGLDKTIWIPVEVTAIGQSEVQAASFDAAIQQGARYIRQVQNEDTRFEIVSTNAAQARFRSPEQPVKNITQRDFSDAPARTARALAGLRRLRRRYEAVLHKMAENEKTSGFTALSKLALLAIYEEDYARADSLLMRTHLKFGDRYEIANNRGNLAFLQGDLENALQNYTQAVDQKSDFLQGYVNRMLLRLAMLETKPERAAEIRKELTNDSLHVARLYATLPQYRELSLARLQGMLFFEESGRGRLAAIDTVRSDSTKTTGAKKEIAKNGSLLRKIRNFFRKMSSRLSPVDPKKRIRYAATSRGKAQDIRLVELLFWSVPYTPPSVSD